MHAQSSDTPAEVEQRLVEEYRRMSPGQRLMMAMEMNRARRQPMRVPDLPENVLHVASAEDTVVQKLAWYRLGGEVSEHQWKDVLGIIKVRRQDLDLAYLRHAAAALAISDLLDRALADSGVE
jgi:hypothetical protein